MKMNKYSDKLVSCFLTTGFLKLKLIKVNA